MNLDFSNVSDYEMLPVGEYETLITKAEIRRAKSGNLYINIRLVIRNDVNQKYQNRNIFYSIFQKKEPTAMDNQVEGFSFKQIMKLCKSAGLENGKEYADLNEMLRDLIGKTIRVTIEHNEYNGNISERVKYVDETKFKECRHKAQDESTKSSNQSYQNNNTESKENDIIGDLSDFEDVINDSDIPF